MPTRRSHNKTRLGCGQCKKRRIKCDGKHPTCLNCEKRQLDCSFLLLAPSSYLSAARAQTTSPDTTSPESGLVLSRRWWSTSPTPQRDLKDGLLSKPLLLPRGTLIIDAWHDCKHGLTPRHQALLQHYADSTCLSMATDGPGKEAWQHFVPGLASCHKYLVHGVLSVASLHLALLNPSQDERENMNRVAADEMNKALRYFQVELHNINEKNAPALFAHSTLTAVFFFRTSTMEMEEIRASTPLGSSSVPDHLVDKMIHSFIKTLWALRGALTVLRPGWNTVIRSKLSSVCTRKWWPRHRVPQNERAKGEDRRLAELEDLWINSERAYEPHFACLSEALKYLRQTFALVSLLTDPDLNFPPMDAPIPYSVDDTSVGMLRDRAAILVWATQLTKEFISLVESRNTEALVLVAFYAVLLGRVRNVWWLEGLGANTVWAVALALGKEKWSLIEWPAQALGLDLEGGFGLQPVLVQMEPEIDVKEVLVKSPIDLDTPVDFSTSAA